MPGRRSHPNGKLASPEQRLAFTGVTYVALATGGATDATQVSATARDVVIATTNG
jgi:hypothetical protein